MNPNWKREKKTGGSKKSVGEETLALQLRGATDLQPVREHRFHPSRKWRFDFAWPDRKVAVEVEGGIWSNGRHTRPRAFEADCEKYNTAAAMGWRVMRFSTGQVRRGVALQFLLEHVLPEGGPIEPLPNRSHPPQESA